MRLRLLILFTAGLALAGCGQNPLLRESTSDYLPLRVGSWWDYRAPGSGQTLRVTVSGGSPARLNFMPGIGAASFQAFQRLPMALFLSAPGGGALALERKLPYVVGDNYSLAPRSGEAARSLVVDGVDNGLVVPAGSFDRCYKLRTIHTYYDSALDLSTTASDLEWDAPDVGWIQSASLDDLGAATVTLQLSAYSIAPN